MASTSHLKSLQALDMALREGSLKAAAERLAITPAALGQRIRALEDYLGVDLIVRGRSGLQPTPELDAALPDLRQAFAALERVSGALNFDRTAEVHIAADIAFAENWLGPRLSAFRAMHPTLRFNINGLGDVPARIGAPDLLIEIGGGRGEALFTDYILPVTSPENVRRVTANGGDRGMEGMPLLHVKALPDRPSPPDWVTWFDRFGHRDTGRTRGVHYASLSLALDATRENVGFVMTYLSLVLDDLEEQRLVLPFPASEHLPAPHPWRLRIAPQAQNRPPIQRLVSWLRGQAETTRESLAELVRRD